MIVHVFFFHEIAERLDFVMLLILINEIPM